MIIQSLGLLNFRNYKYLQLDLDPNINIFYGDNAQGKTNLLEAIYMAGTTKSHKGAKDREVIMFGQEEAHVELKVLKNDLPIDIDLHLKKNKNKGVAVNKVPLKRSGELFGIVNLVFFSPEDLNLIKSAPSERRRFIDFELCQLDKIYLHDILNYHRIVEQRNKLLKESYDLSGSVETLDVWDMQLAKYGDRIIARRKEFIEELQEILNGLHYRLTGSRETLVIDYEPDTGKDSMEVRLARYRERDLKMRTTTVGPHRDDMKVSANQIDLRIYGSQGQQRTAALSLKLAELELVKRRTKDTPILLLDDVLSELDSGRQEYLLDSLGNIQTFITCTGLDDFINHRFHINKTYYVENGTVKGEAYDR